MLTCFFKHAHDFHMVFMNNKLMRGFNSYGQKGDLDGWKDDLITHAFISSFNRKSLLNKNQSPEFVSTFFCHSKPISLESWDQWNVQNRLTSFSVPPLSHYLPTFSLFRCRNLRRFSVEDYDFERTEVAEEASCRSKLACLLMYLSFGANGWTSKFWG